MDDLAIPGSDAAAPPRKRGGGRTRQRRHGVRVACTEPELAAIIAAAARAGLSVSAFMRFQALGTAGPRAVRVPHPDRQLLARVLAATGSLGSNVNQMARIANTTGALPAADALEAMATAVRDIRSLLMQALGRGD